MVFTAHIDGWDEFVTAVNSIDGVTMDQLIQIARNTNVKVSEAYKYITEHITTHEEYVKDALASSIVELKAVDPLNHPRVRLLGREVPNDGGAGDFYWDADSTDVDDDATIFSVDGIVVGRWKRVYKNLVDPKWYTDIDTCITTLDTTVTTVQLCDSYNLNNETLTIPTNIHLYFQKGGHIENGTLIMNGTYSGGNHHIFGTDLYVTYTGPVSVNPIHYGAIPDDESAEASNTTAITNMIFNLPDGSRVIDTPSSFWLDESWYINNKTVVDKVFGLEATI